MYSRWRSRILDDYSRSKTVDYGRRAISLPASAKSLKMFEGREIRLSASLWRPRSGCLSSVFLQRRP